MVAAKNEKLATIERVHTEAVDAAAQMTPPIRLELLEAVKARRMAAAARAEREAEVRRANAPRVYS